MHLRRLFPLAAALTIFNLAATAQGDTPTTPAATPAEQAQDPDRPHQSPAERLEQLQREVARLEAEIAYVQERVRSSSTSLRDKFASRIPSYRAIDAGASASTPLPGLASPVSTPRQARLMTEEELRELPESIVMTVDQDRVGKAEIDSLVTYLLSLSNGVNADSAHQRATLEAIRMHAMLAAFPDTAATARTKIEKAVADLQAGKSFEDVQKAHANEAEKLGQGDVKISRYCPYGLQVEMAAFGAKEGDVVGPLFGLSGVMLLQIGKRVEAEAADASVIEARMITLPYAEDIAALEKQRGRAALGQVDVAVRSQDLLDKLPGMLRAPTPAPAAHPPTDVKGALTVPREGRGEVIEDKVEEPPAKKDGL